MAADRIELRGILVLGAHGALPEELRRPQPFEVDIDLVADLSAACRSDRLEDTVDYAAVVDAVVAAVSGSHCDLLEHLAERVAAGALAVAEPLAREVAVTVRKLRPPVAAHMASAAVTLRRRRPVARRAFIALGSNLGDRLGYLRQGVASLPDVVAVSPVYESAPVGGPPGQGPYLNAVVELHTALSPRELLGAARDAEAAAHRQRQERWGPRTLDVDVVWVEGEDVHDEDLVVPHPRMWERGFVLAPLADLAPDVVGGRLTASLRNSVTPAGSI